MDMLRITARWTGFTGAPGYSNFFFAAGGGFISDANQVASRVRSAFFTIPDLLAPGARITLEQEAAVVDSDTGMITGYEDIGDVDPVTSISTGSYSGPTGAVVNWRTNDLRNGRRIRGRTFLVPLANNAYDNQGSLTSQALGKLQDFGDTLVGGDLDSEFGVWSRPVNGSGGVFATATSFQVPDLAAVLRSRRD